MTSKTPNYNLEKYDATDPLNLQGEAEGLPFVSTTASGE